jgi:hypothetical protein
MPWPFVCYLANSLLLFTLSYQIVVRSGCPTLAASLFFAARVGINTLRRTTKWYQLSD